MILDLVLSLSQNKNAILLDNTYLRDLSSIVQVWLQQILYQDISLSLDTLEI